MTSIRAISNLLDGTLWEGQIPEPLNNHLQDAIKHVDVYDNGWSFNDFEITYVGFLSVKEISQYDDISSWIEVAEPDDLTTFRNGDWDQSPDISLPPVIVITAPDEGSNHTQLGDGRGRVNFAVAHDLRLHTYHMIFKS